MKLSELIEAAARAIRRYGDLPVFAHDELDPSDLVEVNKLEPGVSHTGEKGIKVTAD